MRSKRFTVVVLLIAIFLGAVQAQPAKKVQYRLHLQKGKKYYIKTLTEQQITQSMMGKEQNIEQTIGMGMDFDVNDVNDRGDVWVQYAYRWVKMQQKGTMGETAYDSNQASAVVPPAAQGFAALLNEGFAVKITPQGKAVQVKGLDRMRNNIGQKLPAGPMREYMIKSLDQFLSEDAIKEFSEGSLAMYPEQEVGIGDSWTKVLSLTRGFPITVVNKWTLKDRKAGVATIDIASEIKPNPNAKPMEMGTTKMTFDLGGTQRGQARMDEATGLLLSSKIEQQISGQIKMTIPAPPPQPGQSQPQTPGEMVIPMKIKGTVTTEIKERQK